MEKLIGYVVIKWIHFGDIKKVEYLKTTKHTYIDANGKNNKLNQYGSFFENLDEAKEYSLRILDDKLIKCKKQLSYTENMKLKIVKLTKDNIK